MATESGYDNQKKYGPSQFKTIHNLGSNRYGVHVATKSLTERFAIPVAITAVAQSADGKSIRITCVAHGGLVGDIVRLSSGALLGAELEIIQVIDADNFVIRNVVGVPSVADTFKILYFITNKVDAEGNVISTSGPVKYVLDSVEVTATFDNADPTQNKSLPTLSNYILDGNEVAPIVDTVTPANNAVFPVQLYSRVDGVEYPVNIDTGTPSNTVPVPVTLYGAAGPINITAGDLNVQLTDQGVNADVTRIGDGTTQLAIVPVTGEAKVSDADALVELQAILAGVGSPSDPLEADPVNNDASLIAYTKAILLYTNDSLTELQSLNASSANIEGNLDIPLSNLETELQGIAALDFSTETTLAAMSAKLPAALGQAAEAGSLSVVLATEQEAILTSLETELQGIAALDFSTETTLAAMSAKLPAVLGQAVSANSISVALSTEQEAILQSIGGVFLTAIDFLQHDCSGGGSITSAAYTTIIANTTSESKTIRIWSQTGESLLLAIGAIGVEQDVLVIPFGSSGQKHDLIIPANSRVSIKSLGATVNSGEKIVINTYGL